MEFIEVIKSRQSIRNFLDKPIPENILGEIFEAGRLAPSAQNRQCWQYIAVNDKQIIKALALKSGMIGKVNFFIKDAPLILIATANPKDSIVMNNQHYYLVDVAISFQQMMLTAWNYGIGSCWLAAFNESKVREILNIPKDIKIIALSPFGYPKKKNIYTSAVSLFAKSSKRKTLEKIIHWNQW